MKTDSIEYFLTEEDKKKVVEELGLCLDELKKHPSKPLCIFLKINTGYENAYYPLDPLILRDNGIPDSIHLPSL